MRIIAFLGALVVSIRLCADSGFLIGDDAASYDMFSSTQPAVKTDTATFSQNEIAQMISLEALNKGVDSALALSIAKVESNFNPRAVSSSNAYGVMQLKMDTAVRDVYSLVYQSNSLPDSYMLFDARENIRLGVAYLSLIQTRFFRDIQNRQSLEYCTIAAYNAGAGTVLRAFHPDKAVAVKMINAMTPDDVLRRLLFSMDSAEGRRYVLKVLGAKKLFSPDPITLSGLQNE